MDAFVQAWARLWDLEGGSYLSESWTSRSERTWGTNSGMDGGRPDGVADVDDEHTVHKGSKMGHRVEPLMPSGHRR